MTISTANTALVTGASQGIGEAVAIALAKQKIHVILVSRTRARLNMTQKKIQEADGTSECMTIDLANSDSVASNAAKLHAKFDSIDVLVNCGGQYECGSWQESDVEQLDSLYSTNVRGPYHLTKSLLPLLIKSQGDIVFINSSIVFSDGRETGHFAATQHAMKGLTDSLRAEVNSLGVRVLSIFPGRTATPRQRIIFAEQNRDYSPAQLLQPEDIADILLASLSLPDTAEVTDIRIRPKLKS